MKGDVSAFIDDMPGELGSAVVREAARHHRSQFDELVALVEEALNERQKGLSERERAIQDKIAKLNEIRASCGPIESFTDKPMAEIIEYDELGLPR